MLIRAYLNIKYNGKFVTTDLSYDGCPENLLKELNTNFKSLDSIMKLIPGRKIITFNNGKIKRFVFSNLLAIERIFLKGYEEFNYEFDLKKNEWISVTSEI